MNFICGLIEKKKRKRKKEQVKLKKIISEEIQCSLMIKVVKIFFHFDSQKPNIDKIKI